MNINLPLLDVVQQVLINIKFLKDLCTVKRKECVKNKAYIAEQVSSIIKHNLPPKLKAQIISCTLGNQWIYNALLD